MINPSINGWIDKFFIENKDNFIDFNKDYKAYYEQLRTSGFIYGHIVSIPLKEEISLTEYSQDEITKIALLNALYNVYCITEEDTNEANFIIAVKDFYKIIQHENYKFLKNLLPEGNIAGKVEAIINNRIQTNANFISKNFTHIITNALLFIDVLAFHYYLIHKTISSKYIKDLEMCCIQIVTLAFQVKENKSKYDELLIKVFENSLRFNKISILENTEIEDLKFENFSYLIEKLYLLDLTEMALWSDKKLEEKEVVFLNNISKKLDLPQDNLTESCANIDRFIEQYKDEIPYFNYSNPVKHFYDQTNRTVAKLITRNKNRLIKEISESKELMLLLAQSTTRDLDANEKKKVKKQLLDICKTIPSLTIFLLPGGSILLPILIKYIPQLLPSAFNENLED
ncbi:LETM1-related biofilm-associated protein [Flavobacterium haoranii]|uniref:LETM1-like protein n=1 Tax=Flavobacterium haoranii TaxID=683124 RepID=A0A1M6LWJ2_9FLAO|nr:LETM1-related biofilm-associated protein [Flavobacterium haoranii]SHJ75624.1 LETM1-like protein [Flavobacterium haoranii]